PPINPRHPRGAWLRQRDLPALLARHPACHWAIVERGEWLQPLNPGGAADALRRRVAEHMAGSGQLLMLAMTGGDNTPGPLSRRYFVVTGKSPTYRTSADQDRDAAPPRFSPGTTWQSLLEWPLHPRPPWATQHRKGRRRHDQPNPPTGWHRQGSGATRPADPTENSRHRPGSDHRPRRKRRHHHRHLRRRRYLPNHHVPPFCRHGRHHPGGLSQRAGALRRRPRG